MIPVLLEDFSQPVQEDADSDVEILLSYDGVKLLNQQNQYIEEAMERIMRLVRETIVRAGD